MICPRLMMLLVQVLAPQIEEAVLEPDLLGIFLVAEHRHRQFAGRPQHLDLADIDLDLPGRQVGVLGAVRTPAHLAVDPHHPLRAQRLRQLEGGRIRVGHHLGDAVVVAQVDEEQAPVVADAVAPAGEPDFLADVGCPAARRRYGNGIGAWIESCPVFRRAERHMGRRACQERARKCRTGRRQQLCDLTTGLDSMAAICTLGSRFTPSSGNSMAKAKQSSSKRALDATIRMTTAEATVAALIAHGVDTVYALPGVHNDHLFDALFKAGNYIRTIHTRHEQGAAYLALGAALATARPQAYAVVPGPGLLNSSAALLTAYGMNAPVLGLIGQIKQSSIGRGLGHLHEIRDQAGIISRLVDFSARIREPGEAAPLVAAAMLRDGERPARPGGARMRHRRLGPQRAGGADRRALPAGRNHRSTKTPS